MGTACRPLDRGACSRTGLTVPAAYRLNPGLALCYCSSRKMGTNRESGLSNRQGKETAPSGTDARGDDEVINRVRGGDIEAFSILVRRYQKRMLNIAYRMCGDYEDSCDIVQESFISAFKALKGFRGDASFSTWLTGIVMNNARNRIKQRKGLQALTVSLDAGTQEAPCGHEIPSTDRSPFEQLGNKDIQAAVQACLGMMEPEFREVLVLRDFQEHSYAEVSEILGLAEGTVKSRLFRAREALKECLKKKLGDMF